MAGRILLMNGTIICYIIYILSRFEKQYSGDIIFRIIWVILRTSSVRSQRDVLGTVFFYFREQFISAI